MSSFSEANQARLSLKMMLIFHAWYQSSSVASDDGDFIILVHVSHMDNTIRRTIPIVHRGVNVKVDVASSK